jgi:hypothetical protein
METRISKIRCIKDLQKFVEGNEYRCDDRLFVNEDNSEDKCVIVIESTDEDDMENCYFIPVSKLMEHFVKID